MRQQRTVKPTSLFLVLLLTPLLPAQDLFDPPKVVASPSDERTVTSSSKSSRRSNPPLSAAAKRLLFQTTSALSTSVDGSGAMNKNDDTAATAATSLLLQRQQPQPQPRQHQHQHERRRLAPLKLHATDCPNGGTAEEGLCEAAPVAVPSDGERFNAAGAVELFTPGRPGAFIGYTLDGSVPTAEAHTGVFRSSGGGRGGRGLVELHVDPPCPQNAFSRRKRNASASFSTYCTFAPRERSLTITAVTFGRDNRTAEDSAVLRATYSIWTGRHGRAVMVPYYHGEANEPRATNHDAEGGSGGGPDLGGGQGGAWGGGQRVEAARGYSGVMVEVQLDTMPFKQVHIHDVITDFADFTEVLDGVPKSPLRGFVGRPDAYGLGGGGGGVADSDVVGLSTADSGGSDNQFIDGAFSNREGMQEYFLTAHGMRPLPTTNHWSRSLGIVPYLGQLRTLDLAAAPSLSSHGQELRGFWSGFAARGGSGSGSKEYGFLVPYYHGDPGYSSVVVRVDLADFHTAGTEEQRADAIRTLDLADALANNDDDDDDDDDDRAWRARGFAGGFAFGGHAYFAPLFDGVRAGSLVLRVPVDSFDSAEALDLSSARGGGGGGGGSGGSGGVRGKSLAGFQGGVSYVDRSGAAFGLLVPNRGATAPLHGDNTALSADGFKGTESTSAAAERGAVGGGHQTARYASKVVRFEIQLGGDFSEAPLSVLDLSRVDPDLRGFSDGVVVGAHLYLVPYRNDDGRQEGTAGYFGKVVQIDLERFDDAADHGVAGEMGDPTVAVQVLDLTQVPDPSSFGGRHFGVGGRGFATGFSGGSGGRPDLTGFSAGVAWGKWLLLVPGRNGGGFGEGVGVGGGGGGGVAASRRLSAGEQGQGRHGMLVGIDLSVYPFGDRNAVKVLDLSTVTRQQLPKLPDSELRGFSGGFASGDYLYLTPQHNGASFFGKVVRVDMRDFEALCDLQHKQARLVAEQRYDDDEQEEEFDFAGNAILTRQAASGGDGTDDGSRTGTNSLGHDGVQVLDLQWQDRHLCGFSGGFASFSDLP